MSIREMRDEETIRNAAHEHYVLNGDRVKAKSKDNTDAHSSYDVLRGTLTKYAVGRLGGNWQDAEDAVQDAYVKVLETAKVNAFFNFGGLYKIWLDRSIRDIRIRNKRVVEVIVEDREVENSGGLTLIDLAEGNEPDTELLIEVQNKVNELIDMSNEFPHTAKAIIRLTVLFGYSYKEVSDMTGVKIKRVENTLGYFKRKYYELG